MLLKNNRKKFVLVIVAIFIVLYYFICTIPLMVNNIKLSAEKNVYSAINYGIKNLLSSNEIIYDNIINISYDSSGNVSTIKTDIKIINELSSKLGDKTEESLLNTNNGNISIKLGCLSGVTLLSGLGPNINFNIASVDYVQCEFSSKFLSQGINQTLHSIYVNVHAVCGVVIPFKKIKIDNFQQFLICETVIVGKIPEVYLFSDNLDSLYNFVPIG